MSNNTKRMRFDNSDLSHLSDDQKDQKNALQYESKIQTAQITPNKLFTRMIPDTN